MIDTMKFKIRISPEQYDKIKIKCLPVEYFDKKGQMKRKLVGRVYIPPHDGFLTININCEFPNILNLEGSLPKAWYGENVHLFYINQFIPFMDILQATLIKQFGSFPDYSLWEIQKIDVCYAWIFPTFEEALKVIEYTQTLEYLRKVKTSWPNESVDFIGGSTKIKFYLKGPEFLKNSFGLLKDKGRIEFAEKIYSQAKNVLRFEVMYRRKALREYFNKTSIRCDILTDDTVLIEMLTAVWKNFTANMDKEAIELNFVLQALIARYKVVKALRLFSWYYTYILSKVSTKSLIRKVPKSSGLISANKRDIEAVDIHIPTMLDVAPFKFPIPSDMVINPPPDGAAAAATAEEIIKEMNKVPDEQLVIDDVPL